MTMHTLPGQARSCWVIYASSDHDGIEVEWARNCWIVTIHCTNRYNLPGADVRAMAMLEDKEAENKRQMVMGAM